MFEVIEHLPDAPAALRLAFGAVATIVGSFPNPVHHGSHMNECHVNDWTLDEFEAELGQAAGEHYAAIDSTLPAAARQRAAAARPRPRGVVLGRRGPRRRPPAVAHARPPFPSSSPPTTSSASSRAIDSALGQDYPAEAIEVIVVDDGSTDGTPELMKAYDGRVKYIRKENGGHLSTFDRGIGEATGDCIALLDGDDEWPPHKLREQVDLLEARPDLGLVHGDMRVVDGDGTVLADSFFAERNIVNVEGDLLWALMRHNTITTSAVLVRASLRDRFHPIPAWARVQDWWISLRVAEVAGIGCINEPIVDYRRHGANINHGRQGRRRAELLKAELPLRRWLLTGSAIEKLSSRDAAAGFTALERAADGAADGLDLTRRELLPADRAAGEERLALGRASDDVDVATRHFVAALAHDPWNAMARRALAEAGRTAGWVAAPVAKSAAPVVAAPARERIDGARAFVTLAEAGELAAHPSCSPPTRRSSARATTPRW